MPATIRVGAGAGPTVPLFLYKIEVHFIWNLYANCYTL
jgi:hypothetical protein